MNHHLCTVLLTTTAPLVFTACTNPDQSNSIDYSMRSMEIPFTSAAPAIDGVIGATEWASANEASAFVFPWWTEGEKEPTRALLQWDEQYLYVAFECADAFVWSEKRERDGPVYEDDCVEVFTSPDPDRLMEYFNVEMNVRGDTLDYYHPQPGSKEPWDPELIIATSVDGTLNDDSDRDQGWALEVAIPFEAFRSVAKNTPPLPGDEWRLNLHRLGGETNAQFSQWSPSTSEKVAFHTPQFFGRVTFVK